MVNLCDQSIGAVGAGMATVQSDWYGKSRHSLYGKKRVKDEWCLQLYAQFYFSHSRRIQVHHDKSSRARNIVLSSSVFCK